MISSFFSKTQPIHYIILLGFVFFLFWATYFLEGNATFSTGQLLLDLLYVFILITTIYLADLMAKKGKMTDQSAYFLLFMALQFLIFPEALQNPKGFWAQLFLLLAVQRLLESKSQKNIKHKIFDGALLICVATLFHSLALFFLALMIFTVNTYARKTLKVWLSAIAGMATFALLAYLFLVVFDDGGYVAQQYIFEFNFESIISRILEKADFKVLGYGLAVVVFGLVDFIKYSKKGGGKIILFRFMLLYFVIALLVTLLDHSENTYLILAFIPAAIFLSNYVQTIKKARLKEMALTAFLIVSVGFALFDFLV